MTDKNTTRKIILDSRDGNSGSSNSIQSFQLGDILKDERKFGINWVAIDQAEIPNTFYNVLDRNNDFTLEIYQADGTTLIETITCEIPVGFYDITSLMAAIKTEVELEETSGGVYTVSQSDITGKITITDDGGTNKMKFIYANSTMGNVMGFRADSAVAVSITGDSIVDLRGITSVYIWSNLNDSFIRGTGSGGQNNSFLGEVKVDVGFGQTIFYQPTNSLNIFRLDGGIKDNLRIELRSRNNEVIDLNGLHWKISMLINYKI